MSRAVIQVEGLSKRYRIGEQERYLALRDLLANALRAPLRLLRSAGSSAKNHQPEFIWALKDVSFEVNEAEVVGIIGRNGAGKTTLLKILARVTRPTEGYAEVRGRMGSLLEVGTGFHGELTGRENVYLSGAILGMTKREIERKFDEIVAFAEVEKFIDTPLKHYSTGMQTRLAFAVAAHLEPEILLVDEVLAVGDINFQKKCLGKMGDVARQGRTVVFVSHQMNQMRRLCQRVMWIDGGRIRMSGPTHEVVSAYEAAMARGDRLPSVVDNSHGHARGHATKARFVKWEIAKREGQEPHILAHLGSVTVNITVDVREPIKAARYGMALYNHEQQLICAWGPRELQLDIGEHQLRHTFPMLPLRPGPYNWLVTLYEDGQLLDWWNCLPEMIVAAESHQTPYDEWTGMLNIPDQFETEHGTRATGTAAEDRQDI